MSNAASIDGINPLEIHPFAGTFPPFAAQLFRDLVKSIEDHGQREPIVLYQGQILDGRNRYAACKEAGIEPRFTTFKGSDQKALQYVIDLNLTRRHLTEGQRAMVASKLASMRQGERTDLGSIEPRLSKSEAAETLKVSRASSPTTSVPPSTKKPAWRP